MVSILALITPISPPQVPGHSLTFADMSYLPGYVAYDIPISLFVPKYLQSACAALKKGEMKSAEKSFAAEIRKNPQHLGAVIGFLQSKRDQWDKLLPQYEKEAKLNPTAANEFKLGALAYYILEENLYRYEGVVLKRDPKNPHHFYGFGGGIPSKELVAQRSQITNIANYGLERTWKLTHDPIVVILISPYPIIDHYGKMLEEVIQRVGGARVYQTFIHAERNDWNAPQPAIKNGSLLDLTLLHFVVRLFLSNASFQRQYNTFRKINGKQELVEVTAPLTDRQKHAKAYLGLWLKRISKRVNEMKSKTHRR